MPARTRTGPHWSPSSSSSQLHPIARVPLTGFVRQRYSNVLSSAGWELKDHVCWQGIYGGYYRMELTGSTTLLMTSLAISARCSSWAVLPMELLKPTGSLGRGAFSIPWCPPDPLLPPSCLLQGMLLLLSNKQGGARAIIEGSCLVSGYHESYIHDVNML